MVFNKIKPFQHDLDNDKVLLNKQQSIDKIIKRHFLYSILPKSGYICIAELTTAKSAKEKPKMYYKWFSKRKDAIKYIRSFEDKTRQIFVAQASFRERGTAHSGRSQIDAKFLRNFFMDIDNGKNKPYTTQAESKKKLLSFCTKTGLPIPAIVISGNGLYAHWPLTSDVKVAEWKTVAQKLKKLVNAIEPGLDHDGLITDTARILRPVGSTHRKDPNTPKKVKILQDCEPNEFNKFEMLLDNAIAALPTEPEISNIISCLTTKDVVDNHSSAIKIAQNCSVIAEIQKTKGNVSEPLWYASIGLLRHCDDATNIIHEWSMGHPDYSIEETNFKILQHKMPPTTCKFFAELCPQHCNECKYNGKINSPISLGITKPSFKDIPDYIEELNKIHFVSRYGGKTVVFREAHDGQLNRNFIEKSSFSDFKNFFNNQKVIVGANKDGAPISIPLGNAWLEHEGRRQFEGIIMSPEGEVENYFNLWRGFSVEPIKGSWELMRKHIRNVICNRDRMLFRYVKNWLARLIQQPWTPGEVALVLKGGKGIGKGMLANNLCRIVGQHSCSVRNSKHVTGNFNAHMDDCILLYVDEAFWAGSKEAESVLKGIITEPTLFIEPKFVDPKEKRNMLHIIMTSNNDWVVPASYDERRFCVLEVSEHRKNDRKYFNALANEINNGGLEAMLHDLLNLDISDFEVRNIPQTDALTKQKILSLEPVHAWWHQKLKDGELLPGIGWNTVPSQELYDNYVISTKKQGIKWPGTHTSFGIELHKVLSKKWPNKFRMSSIDESGKRPNYYEFPSLKDCRKYFEKFLGDGLLDWD